PGWLLSDAVVAWPSGIRPSRRAVAAGGGSAVRTRFGVARSEIGDLAHRAGEPAPRPAVVVSDDRRGGLARAQGGVAALPVPGRVEAGDARSDLVGSRDARTVGALAH